MVLFRKVRLPPTYSIAILTIFRTAMQPTTVTLTSLQYATSLALFHAPTLPTEWTLHAVRQEQDVRQAT